jgi:YVTN family beta-propeller protein
VGKAIVGFVLSLGGMSTANPTPGNPVQQALYSLAKDFNDVLDPAPPAGKPTVNTRNQTTGVVTGDLGFPTGNGLTFTATQPSSGMVTVADDGSFTYTPSQAALMGNASTDAFAAVAHEGLSTSAVSVTVPIGGALAPGTIMGTVQLSNRDARYISVSGDGTHVYVPSTDFNGTNPTVTMIDTATMTATTLTTGSTLNPGDGAVGTKNTVYVVNVDLSGSTPSFKSTITLVDASTNTLVSTVDVASMAANEALSPDGSRLYVSIQNPSGLGNDDSLSIVDTKTLAVTNVSVKAAGQIAVSPDGTRVYVGNYLIGSVSVLDANGNQLATIPDETDDIGNNGVRVSADGSRLYATSLGASSPGADFQPVLTVVDTATNTVISKTYVPVQANSWPSWGIVSPDGTRLYELNHAAGTVLVYDTTSTALLNTFTVPNPIRLAISPDGKELFVLGDGTQGSAVTEIVLGPQAAAV